MNILKIDLSQKLDESRYFDPSTFEVATRSHYNQLYFARGSIWDSASLCGNGEFQITPTGFATEFDGGGNYDESCNWVIHVWGEMVFLDSEGNPIDNAEEYSDRYGIVWTAWNGSTEVTFLTEVPDYTSIDYQDIFVYALKVISDHCLGTEKND